MLTVLTLNVTSLKVYHKKFLTKTKNDSKNIANSVYIGSMTFKPNQLHRNEELRECVLTRMRLDFLRVV